MIGSHTAAPKAYLNQFARNQSPSDRKPKLWVYERGKSPFPSTPRRVGKKNGYFAVKKDNGSRDESMEEILATLEARGAGLLPLLNCETYVMSSRDHESVIGYIALAFARASARRDLSRKMFGYICDAYRELVVDDAWLREQVKAYEYFTGVLTSPEQMSGATKKVIQKMSDPEQANNGFVQGLLRLAEGIFTDLRSKPWQIWEAPDGAQFITTDNPVITLKADTWGAFSPGWGFRTPGATAAFPLSPRCCLVIGDGIPAASRYWRRATPRDVNGVNQALAMCMDRWAYAADRSMEIEQLVNRMGGSVRYGVNAFVPAWMSNAPNDIKEKVRKAIGSSTARIGPSPVRPNARRINLISTESNY
jgi:hypothetical protein